MAKKLNPKAADFEPAVGAAEHQIYVLKLCISGMTLRSRLALVNLKQICDQYLEGLYVLEGIVLYLQPELAARLHFIATPPLLKNLPPPARQLFGDLTDTKATLRRLGFVIEEDQPS
jgi:circadian clock protein KaiB